MGTPGKPKLPPRRQIIFRIDESLLLETYTLNPKLIDPRGGTRYGSLNKYITRLIVEDNARIKKGIKRDGE